MAIDAYVIRYKTDEAEFLSFFLSSADFDIPALKNICRKHNMNTSGNKTNLVDRVRIAALNSDEVKQSITQNIVARQKNWLVFKTGTLPNRISALNPIELVGSAGEPSWYGPVHYERDPSATWYLRPVFVEHWELLEGFDGPQETTIRWMFFARVSDGIVSYHWRGFSYTSGVDDISKQNSQFPYWEFVPDLMEEFETMTEARSLETIDLHDLILHKMWDYYRYDKQFGWDDLRIRAESGGVSLSARASSSVEIDVPGIRRLANTIRRAIDRELTRSSAAALPNSEWYDEVILRTIIRELGALSYEFHLEDNNGNTLFRGHTYFGLKGRSSPDAFAHINVHTSSRSEVEQMNFLLDFARYEHERKDTIAQPLLFS